MDSVFGVLVCVQSGESLDESAISAIIGCDMDDLFDDQEKQEGIELGREGAQAAFEAAGKEFISAILDAIISWAATHAFFTVEDVKRAHPNIRPRNRHPDKSWGCLGRIILSRHIGVKFQWVKPSGRLQHGSPVMQYRSLLYDGRELIGAENQKGPMPYVCGASGQT